MTIFKIFCSYKFVIFLMLILAVFAGIATFLENIYDTQTARILIYNAFWYETVMFVLFLSLICIMIKNKIWRKFGAFFIHFAFIFIILGAFLTRYFGEESILHIRQNQTSNEILSVKPYLQIKSNNEFYAVNLNLTMLGNNNFLIKKEINGKEFFVKFKSYEKQKNKESILCVEANYQDEKTQNLCIKGGAGYLSKPEIFEQNGEKIEISWGAKVEKLPFFIKLKKFELQKYQGSQTPSSFASYVEVIDDENTMDYKIFMNNPLNYKGYKFFQSSYDFDELGTILEINKDLGKIPTYIGYFLLCFGFLMNFFTKNSRFVRLLKFVKNSQSFAIFFIFFCANLNSFEIPDSFLQKFNQILVQDEFGRIKPLNTEAFELINKISYKNSKPEKLILNMSLDPNFWNKQKIIKIKNKKIKQILSLKDDEKFVSLDFMFDEFGRYKIENYVKLANQIPAVKRDNFENDIIKFDERVNITYLIFKGYFLKFIPKKNSKKWLSFNEVFEDDIDFETKNLFYNFLESLKEGAFKNNWTDAEKIADQIIDYQKKTSQILLPSDLQIKAEIFYNKIEIFKILIYCYAFLSIFSFIFGIFKLFIRKNFKSEKIIFSLLVMYFLLHSFWILLRFYIAGYAPLSNSYETTIFIAWSIILSGILFYKKSIFVIFASTFLATIFLFVAQLSFINPQITNLVPVLKSYWLIFHVCTISSSYGFLGLNFILGVLILFLMSINTKSQISYLSAISELSLIVGLSLLTIGNFLGAIWANESWGRYWGWDSKETWSFVSILIYVCVFHLRFINKSIYVFAVLSVFAYFSIVMTFFGVNFYLTGMHSYGATGEIPKIPNFIFFIIIFLISLCGFAYKNRFLKENL